ncbi:hypothetical protein K431DRAFT_233321 [Polychaeton citri CBS 116435]|uniref:Phospholipid/glycerol acyltransferase domain-containing protein n=1 Tax=Polychaeton citri CBS 116435 TaxID=1314669 RepID=A0A9P4PYL2_9PEZI|nr:hypothetical protein K431DRAFT_233321 [Polychaeton citri CBS 116435]
MEKYGQYRDKGSGIAPFFPIPASEAGAIWVPIYFFLFCLRLPFLLFFIALWLVITQWLPPGSLLRKANLWCVLGVPGIWWVDLQVDGVRRGSLASGPRNRLPGPGTIIASSHTSPIDALYLAAIFDPVFTQSFAGTKEVQHVGLWQAVFNAFSLPPAQESVNSLHTLDSLLKSNPNRIICVFPETTTSNGRGILRLSPSILSVSNPKTKVYPINLRYTPADITTPVPGITYAWTFLWRLCSRPTHCIRTRIGQKVMTSAPIFPPVPKSSPSKGGAATTGYDKRRSYEANFFDTLNDKKVAEEHEDGEGVDEGTIDAVAEALARLGRVKRVDLGLGEKTKFVQAWTKGRRRR